MSHPHPLRSNPVLPENSVNPNPHNTTVNPTQDVDTGLGRAPALKRTNTFSSTQPRQQPALRRSNTVNREAGLPAAQSTERASRLTRQPAVRRPNMSAIQPGLSEGITSATNLGESQSRRNAEASTREVPLNRPFSFNRGADMIDPRRTPLPQMTTIPEGREVPQKVRFEDNQVFEPGKFRTHASMLITGDPATILQRPSHLPLAKNADQTTEVILLNNRLRTVMRWLDDIDRTYRQGKLTTVMVQKIKAHLVKSQKAPKQLRVLGVSNSETVESQDSKVRIEEWRGTIQITLNVISSILKKPVSSARDEALMAALTKSVEDAEKFVSSFDVNDK